MVGFLQIIIYLLCVYLGFKGIEIFQIAFMSDNKKRGEGMALGVLMTLAAIAVSIVAVILTDGMAEQMQKNFEQIGR